MKISAFIQYMTSEGQRGSKPELTSFEYELMKCTKTLRAIIELSWSAINNSVHFFFSVHGNSQTENRMNVKDVILCEW